MKMINLSGTRVNSSAIVEYWKDEENDCTKVIVSQGDYCDTIVCVESPEEIDELLAEQE